MKFLVFTFLLLSSCAFFPNKELETSVPNTSTVLDLNSTDLNPVELEMTQAYIGDRTLYLKVILITKDIIPTKDIIVGMLAKNNQELKEEQYQRLSDIIPGDKTSIGGKTAIYFKTSIDEITDFDLVCLYGEEAKKVDYLNLNETGNLSEIGNLSETKLETHKIKTIPEINIVKLDNIQLIEETIGKSKKLGLKGSLLLPKDFKIGTSLKIAFSLVYVPDGKIPNIPSDLEPKKVEEDELDFTTFVKEGVYALPFEVSVGKSVPIIKGGRFIPYVRIISTK